MLASSPAGGDAVPLVVLSQAQLVDAGSELVSRAGGLQSTLDLVLHYERRGNALLSYVMGR
jgi:hypothetical protein